MKLLILSVCVVLAAADVSDLKNQEKNAAIVKQGSDIAPDGTYQWHQETENGIRSGETGSVKQTGPKPEDAVIVAQGSASWTSPEGQVFEYTYTADENGYQPQGDFLPTSPPIPELILRGLEYLKAHAQPEDQN